MRSFPLALFLLGAAGLGGEVEVLLEKAELARKEKRSGEALSLFRDLLTRAPAHLEAHLGYQKLLQSQGKEPELVKEYQELADKHPEPWALFLLGRLLHDPPREEALYRRALERVPGDFRCRMALGSALERQLRIAEAEKEYRECLRLEPDSPEAHASLMRLFDEDGRIGELLPEYRERAQKASDDWRAQFLCGKALGMARDWEGSGRHFQRARELAANEPRVLRAIAAWHLKQSQIEEAQRIIEKLLLDHPFDPDSVMLFGSLKAMLQKDSSGLPLLEEAVRLEPGESFNFNQLGLARFLHRDFTGAEASLKEAIRLNGASAYAIAGMGNLCLSRQEYLQAREWFEKAVRLKPRTADYRIWLAQTCEKLGLHDRARQEREEAGKLRKEADFNFRFSQNRFEVLDQPQARARELAELASALVIAGRFEEATAKFEESISAAPDLEQSYWLLARVEKRRGRLKEALIVLSRLEASLDKQRRPSLEVADALRAMAECRYELGEAQEALRLWRDARDKLPEGLGRSRLEELIRRLEAPDPAGEVFRIADVQIAECTARNWCVPKSVAAVLSHWKIPTDTEKLARELGMDAGKGITSAALLEGLQKRADVKAACFSFRPALVKGLLKKGYPVLWFGTVLSDGDHQQHVSVVSGFDDRRGVFHLEDPNWFGGFDRMPLTDIEVHRGILIAPPAEFEAVSGNLPDCRFWELVNRAESLVETDVPQARALLEEAVKMRSDEYLSQLYLGYVNEAESRLDSALEAYRRADRLRGADARVSSRLARVLLGKGDVKEAEKTLQEGLKREPTYGPVLAKLLEISWKVRKDPAQALPYCERLLAAVPDTGELLCTKGQILLALDRYDEAIEAFTWASNVEGPPEAHLYLGQLLRAKGDRRRAIAALEKYASLVKDQDEAEKARQTIGEIQKELEAKGR